MGDETTTTPVVKPGYKTTEFWLSTVAVIVGLVMASGAIVEGSQAAQIAGFIASALAAMGYSYSRGNTKAGAGQ